jgi:hypothetical protein
MPARFRLTLAQLNPTVGDLAAMRPAASRLGGGKAAGADMVIASPRCSSPATSRRTS